ncbi:hypothetical protein QTP70_009498 [Hemibagrus guttatus]|uniref:Uncharacterized protein n=1 Tax=Hemibagrus guttatus TaxID=175788 RepID=A0AAE0V5V6_9TELE|nr:hypothetical protein QTP70_009498 [Hemibagrus guttatus]
MKESTDIKGNFQLLPTMEPEFKCELPNSTSPAPVKLTWGEIMDAEDNGLENVEPFCFYNPWSTDNVNQVEKQKVKKNLMVQKAEEQRAEKQARVQQLPVRNKKLPNERLSKNNENPWSTDNVNQVEKQKVKKNLMVQKAEEQRAEKQARVQQLPVRNKKLPNERLSKNNKINMENGHPKGTGFVIFASPDAARNAVMKMNGRVLGSRPVYISVIQSKEEHGGRHRESKVFVKNLDYSVDDRCLHEAFLPFGTVISAKVTVENGRSRGFGFVSYSSPKEAEKAIKEMNGKMMGRRPIYVTLANNTKQRKASLTQTEQWTKSSCPTEPHPRPHRFMQRVHSHHHNRLRSDMHKEYADVFEEDGCLEGEYNLEMDPAVKLVRIPKRRVPVALMKHLKDELGSLGDPTPFGVDYFSNFWEIDRLPDTSSSTVIHKLKAHFARHGIPYTVISDNGPQYSSQEFKQFSTVWEFRHVTLSPAYPQSNGNSESAVKTAKQLMGKAKRAKTDPYLAILEHRNTPSQGFSASPAQRLMSRRTKTLLPTCDSLLRPCVVNTEHAVKNNQCKQAYCYNRGAKDLRPLQGGEQPGLLLGVTGLRRRRKCSDPFAELAIGDEQRRSRGQAQSSAT